MTTSIDINVTHLVLLGGTGFIGSAICRRLEHAQAESIDTRALVRGSVRRIEAPHVTVVRGDLEDLPAALFPDQPHVVLHFATRQIDHDGRGFEAVNVGGMQSLVRALPAQCIGVIYGSSLSVYGGGPQAGIDEQARLAPETELARSRAGAERVLFDAARRRGMTAFALRPRFVLGHGDRSTLPGLLRMFRRGLQLGSGRQRFSVMDVDDYAEIVLRLSQRIVDRAADRTPVQTPFNVAYTRPVKFQTIRTALDARFRLPPPRVVLPISRSALRLMAGTRVRPLVDLATQLALIGFSHYADVRRLMNEIGDDILTRDPASALDRAVAQLSQPDTTR